MDRIIAALGARNMSNTKWREVLDILSRHRGAGALVRIKFVDAEREFDFGGFTIVNDKWVDWTFGPFRTREIDWIEVSGRSADAIENEFRALGRLPIRSVEGGFRVQAYGIALDAPRSQQ